MSSKKTSRIFIPIGVKLIGIVSLIIVLALAGMTFWTTYQFTTDVERSVKFNTLDRADMMSQKIDSDLKNYIDSSRLLAALMEGGLVFQGKDNSYIRNLMELQKDLISIWIVSQSSSGIKVEKTQVNELKVERANLNLPAPMSVIEKYPESFRNAFSGATIMENLSLEYNYPVLALTFPHTMKSATEADSILVVTFTMDALLEALKSREYYINYLVDSTGHLMVHHDQKLVLQRPVISTDPMVREALASSVDQEQLLYKNQEGKLSIGSFRKFFDGHLVVISSVTEELALAQVFEIQKLNIGITAVVLWAAIMLLFFFSRTLTIPVRRLVNGANQIREGNYTIAMPPSANDEIGRLAVAMTEMSKGLIERDKIKSAFGKFVNKEIAEQVMRGEVQLGGELLQAAIFFSDIRSFTEISERLTPHEVVEFLNDYMTRMVDCVNKTHGVVDKYIGDAIMAIWGIPSSRGNDTENAINGALLMREALKEFNKIRKSQNKPLIRIGAGINTGKVVAGQIGSLERMEYTCIGDPVNLASRIESLNKPFQTDILISQNSWEEVKGIFKLEAMKKISVKGKTEPQQVYAVIGRLDDPHCPNDLNELRATLGLENINLNKVDADAQEEKYEILE